MRNSSRVVMNTGILYAKIVVNVIISLLSTRWVLLALGEEDYGIYALVGGIVSVFSFVNAALSSATQRFLSYEIGKGNDHTVKEVFYNSIIIHLFSGIILAVLILIGGTYFIQDVISIPAAKMDMAIFVLYTISISTFFVIICVPYQAAMNAHENLIVISIIEISQSFFKLILAYSLLRYSGSALKLYSVGIMIISIISMLISTLYCYKQYKETHFKWHIINDLCYIKKLGSYFGWLIFGFLCSFGRIQGMPIFLNVLFGVAINAAYGIANQINSQLSFFSSSILRAIRPRIIQSEGEGNTPKMISLSFTASKFSFFCLSCVVIPLIFNIDYILGLWLSQTPQYTSVFTILLLLISLIYQLNSGAFIANESKGKIKKYQLWTGIIDMITLPLGYFATIYYRSPYVMLVVSIVCMLVSHIVGMFITCKVLSIKVVYYLSSLTLPILKYFIPSCITLYLIRYIMNDDFIFLILSVLIYICLSGTLLFNYSANEMEKAVIRNLFSKFSIRKYFHLTTND